MRAISTASCYVWLLFALGSFAGAQVSPVGAHKPSSPVEGGPESANDQYPSWQPLYRSGPLTFSVATIGPEIDSADITDIEVADFNGDGRNDIAVAWFATDLDDAANDLRFLTLYFGEGTTGFVRAVDIDLYVPNYTIEELSVFRHGTADIGVGDFDGDDDLDLAVTPFFGDELWFVENLGGGSFAQHLKYPFGYNSTGNTLTPPEVLAADFDGDNRDELVYISDPVTYWDPWFIHFWRTDDTVANMERARWDGGGAEGTVYWTRGLAIGDFDDDQRPDLCFTGSLDAEELTDPVLVFWHDLDTGAREFAVHLEYPGFLCSDVAALQPDPLCPPGVVITDLDGTEMEFWAHECQSSIGFHLAAAEDGYAGLAADRGMTAVLDDVDGDGDLDVVTRQKLGDLADRNQVEVTLSSEQGQQWDLLDDGPISSDGFQDQPYGDILRPRNLDLGDLFGNTLPEIVAGFGPSPISDPNLPDEMVLRVAYWANSCVGDASVDGSTDISDLGVLLPEYGHSGGEILDLNADLNKDGRVDMSDLSILLIDYGCGCELSSWPG